MLRALGRNTQLAQASLRFSLGLFSTGAEVDYVASLLPRLVEKLRGLSRKVG